jgi:two-component system NtrC family sensor kinase
LLQFRDDLTEQVPRKAEDHWQKAQSRLSETLLGLRRIRELVVKLRTFSRLDEGERKRASVSECIDSVLTILAHRAIGRIKIETECGPPDALECYPALLNQVLLNLVANSIDAIQGPGTISIKAGTEGSEYVITVTDTGSGIPAELRNRVIEPFFTTKGVGEGTGLGLSIAHAIVKKHEGTLTLQDAPGGGTLAAIRIPLRLPRE